MNFKELLEQNTYILNIENLDFNSLSEGEWIESLRNYMKGEELTPSMNRREMISLHKFLIDNASFFNSEEGQKYKGNKLKVVTDGKQVVKVAFVDENNEELRRIRTGSRFSEGKKRRITDKYIKKGEKSFKQSI
jgi:hypothetical protein